MKIILIQDIAGVGRRFDIKDVSDGYALNFLIPQGKAKHASSGALKEIEKEKERAETDRVKKEESALQKLGELKKGHFTIERKATEEGHLFAKVDSKDLVQNFKASGVDIQESQIMLDEPIKQAGAHQIKIKVGEKEVEVEVEVKKTE